MFLIIHVEEFELGELQKMFHTRNHYMLKSFFRKSKNYVIHNEAFSKKCLTHEKKNSFETIGISIKKYY